MRKFGIKISDPAMRILVSYDVLSLREFCVYVVDKYSLTEREIESVVSLSVGAEYKNSYMTIKRII